MTMNVVLATTHQMANNEIWWLCWIFNSNLSFARLYQNTHAHIAYIYANAGYLLMQIIWLLWFIISHLHSNEVRNSQIHTLSDD